jgi:hypothetical protein
MAADDRNDPVLSPNAADHPPVSTPSTRAGVPKKRRPLWLRIIIYATLTLVGLFVFFFIIGLIVGKPRDSDVTSVLRKVATDPSAAARAEISGKFVEAGSRSRTPLDGHKATFYWSLRPSGFDAEITTFDTETHAAAAFAQIKDGDPGSLLFPAQDEGTTVSNDFTTGRVDSPVTKEFHCAQREHFYACASIAAGVPAIVSLREPFEADWHRRPANDAASEDPEAAMAAMEATSKKTDKVADEMLVIDKTLHGLGLPVRFVERRRSPK